MPDRPWIDLSIHIFDDEGKPKGKYPDISSYIKDIVKERKDPYSINDVGPFGRNALSLAMYFESLECCEAILLNGADPNLAWATPLATYSSETIKKLLLDHGLENGTPLEKSLFNGNVDTFEKVLVISEMSLALYDKLINLAKNLEIIEMTKYDKDNSRIENYQNILLSLQKYKKLFLAYQHKREKAEEIPLYKEITSPSKKKKLKGFSQFKDASDKNTWKIIKWSKMQLERLSNLKCKCKRKRP